VCDRLKVNEALGGLNLVHNEGNTRYVLQNITSAFNSAERGPQALAKCSDLELHSQLTQTRSCVVQYAVNRRYQANLMSLRPTHI
jgi:hypothetical protein